MNLRDLTSAIGIVYISPMMDLFTRITIHPEQCHGRPCIRGMRIRVIDVL